MGQKIPVFFHPEQLRHKPLFEWRFGERIDHPETTARAENILNALKSYPDDFEFYQPEQIPRSAILKVHDPRLVQLFEAAQKLPDDQTFYPSVFPPRGSTQVNPTTLNHAGFFCYDSGTPLNSTTLMAASKSASCAWSGAKMIRKEESLMAYALCRPPGHHASRSLFGGYCYFNNAAIAARELLKMGKGVLLDIDFHHGNGTQRIFYRNPDVFFISVHGDPWFYYPYFAGYPEERGQGAAEGTNLNISLEAGTNGEMYLNVLKQDVITAIEKFEPKWLLVSAGFDTYIGDPVGDFTLNTGDYHKIGQVLGKLNLSTLVVQEGGYLEHCLGQNVASFLDGMRLGFLG